MYSLVAHPLAWSLFGIISAANIWLLAQLAILRLIHIKYCATTWSMLALSGYHRWQLTTFSPGCIMTNQQRLMLIVPPLLEKTPAFERAAALAKAKGAALHIVAFDYLEGLATAGLVNARALEEMRSGYVERHRQWLEEQAHPLRHLGIEVTTAVVWAEHPLKEMLTYLHEMPVDLVIKDLQHESLLKRAVFTTLDLQLLHECPYPLHFVAKSHNPTPRRIVAAVDLLHPDDQYSGFNDTIIHEALKLGTQCNAQVDVVYAYDLSMIDAADYSYASASMMFDSNLAPTTPTLYELENVAFDTLAERNGVPVENRHFMLGSPSKVLARFAESQDIDVIVMGRLHHRSLGHLLGSTAERILYKMPGSVLILNPDTSI